MSERGVTVSFGVALLEQTRWFWHRQWIWIVTVTALVAGVSLYIIDALPDEEKAFVFVIFGSAVHQLLVLIALSWALSAWRDDPPKDRQYFWLHPVERTAHTVARSLAAWFWLMLVLAVACITIIVGAIAMHGGSDVVLGTSRFWLYVAGAVSLAYVAGSIAAVLSDKPGLWIVFAVVVVIVIKIIAMVRGIEWILDGIEQVFESGPRSFLSALGAPGYEAARVLTESLPAGDPMEHLPGLGGYADKDPGIALLIWLPVSIVLYLASALLSRPR